jgi:hypothetical protein
MKKSGYLLRAILALAVCVSFTGNVYAQDTAAQGAPVHLLVTAEARHGTTVPEITKSDVFVYEGHDRDQVTDWVPAQGEHAGLELYILIDDGSSSSLDRQLEDIRKFIAAQPASAKIGLAYMQNGSAKVVQSLTSDHDLAAKALRLPLGIGGVSASPYISLSDLFKHWQASADRREVLVVTDGVDPYYESGDLNDPYLDAAIDEAVRAGIVVFGIYNPGAGHLGHSYWLNHWGQIYLARLAEETGGESYYIGFTGSPVAFQPFLEDMQRHLDHQYWLTFNAKARKKSSWQKIKVTTEVSNADLVAPYRAYVTAP